MSYIFEKSNCFNTYVILFSFHFDIERIFLLLFCCFVFVLDMFLPALHLLSSPLMIINLFVISYCFYQMNWYLDSNFIDGNNNDNNNNKKKKKKKMKNKNKNKNKKNNSTKANLTPAISLSTPTIALGVHSNYNSNTLSAGAANAGGFSSSTMSSNYNYSVKTIKTVGGQQALLG